MATTRFSKIDREEKQMDTKTAMIGELQESAHRLQDILYETGAGAIFDSWMTQRIADAIAELDEIREELEKPPST